MAREHVARGFACFVAGTLVASGVLAEEPAAIEEIIVTATKRETALQLTPLAITALTGDFLDSLNAREFNDYLDKVPGLAVVDQGPGRKRYLLRGVSSQDSNLSQSTVAQYVDEVPITNFGNQPDPRLIDIERVEVLRGPQGTLFGARSMAGAIRTVTRKPRLDRVESSYQATGSATRFGGGNAGAEMVANTPLVLDKLALRLSGFVDWQDGYIDNVFAGGTFAPTPGQLPPTVPQPVPPVTLAPQNDPNFSNSKIYGGRAALRWEPSDRLTVDVMGLLQKAEIGAVPSYNVQSTGNESRGLINSVSGKIGNDDKLGIASLTATYAFDGIDLTVVGAHAWRNNFVLDAANAAGPLISNGAGSTNTFGGNDKSWTTEVRLASHGNERLHWIVGGYGYWRTSDFSLRQFIGFGNITLIHGNSHEVAREQAAFGEVSYELTDRLEVTGGIRYAWNYLRLDRFHIVPPPMIQPGADPNHPRATDKAPTYKAEMSYRATDDIFLYALASEGFRPSGYNGNAVPGFDVIPVQFQPDSLWNYEVGAKTRWLDGRLTIDADIYRIDWENIQVVARTATPVGLGTQPYTTNASSAQIYGAELEARARITQAFSIDLALNHFFKAELTANAPTTSGITPRKGDALPYDADWSANLGGEYRFPIADRMNGSVRLDWSYVGPRSTGFRQLLDNGQPNNAYNSFASYNIIDLRVGVSYDRWRLTAFADNLFDARPVITQQNFAPLAVTTRTTRRPRTVGLTVRTNL